MHKVLYANVKFFQGRERAFLAWIGNFIRPVVYQEEETIFQEGEKILEMFFLVKGKVGYILPRFGQKRCLEINQGEHFGHAEIFNNRKMSENLIKSTSHRSKLMKRTFQAVALEEVNSLTLLISDIEKMREEFPDIYESLLKESVNLYS